MLGVLLEKLRKAKRVFEEELRRRDDMGCSARGVY